MKYAACLIVLMTLAANLHAENIKDQRAPAKVPLRPKAMLPKTRPVGPRDYLKPSFPVSLPTLKPQEVIP
jgi:hypothetical protein